MIQLASAAAFRINELRWLRLANVHFPTGGGVAIEVTPLIGVNPLKTEAAKRRVLTVQILWIDLQLLWNRMQWVWYSR